MARAMNLQHRAAGALRPWWKAIAEEPADNRDFDEWSSLCWRLLKYSAVGIAAFVAILLSVAYASPFGSNSVIVALGGAVSDLAIAWLYAMVFGAAVLAAKSGLAKNQESTATD